MWPFQGQCTFPWVSLCPLCSLPLPPRGYSPFPLGPHWQLSSCSSQPCSMGGAPNTAWTLLPLEICSALAGRGRVIPRDGLGELHCWDRELQPCGCGPRNEWAPSSSLQLCPSRTQEGRSTELILLWDRAAQISQSALPSAPG